MQDLYLDCDGVILDTIAKSYEILDKMEINDQEERHNFFKSLNWKEFIIEAGEINNSIFKIREIISSGLYRRVMILTHINSSNEGKAKIDYFSKMLPNIKVITVFKGTNKADAVEAKGAILVDDFLPNLDYWYEKGGVPIKFSDSGKSCKYRTITDLSELLEKVMFLSRRR